MKPVLSDTQLIDVWDKLTSGEPLDNETGRKLFQDLSHYQNIAAQYKFLNSIESRIAIREARKRARAI